MNKRLHVLLKVMCDNVLYETELLVISRLGAFLKADEPNRGITLRLKEHLHFATPFETDEGASTATSQHDDEHFYFIFETGRSNLFQTITTRK
jgi:hypothetical protein